MLRIPRPIGAGTVSMLLALATCAHADAPKAANPAPKGTTPLPTGQLTTTDWLKASTASLQPGEIDRLIGANLKKANIKPAPRTTDEEFIRRLTLDLTGRLPTPAEITEFLADKNPSKRARLIDTLLDSDDFAKHWALYFRDVITSRTTDQRARLFVPHFEKWLTGQLKANTSWAAITRAILTASGTVRVDDVDKNGQAFFLSSRFGPDAAPELAAETSRIFLGIQIQCAQCHDHPSDVWKRRQFHEFAAFFVRVKDKPIREDMKLAGQELVSLPFAEHKMPGKDDPKKGTPVSPRFIDGKAPKSKSFRLTPTDMERRQALAEYITSRDDPWFAGAFANRIWGELMGQSFYMPIDDMGPQKDAVMPEVLARVAAAFRGSDYDIKGLFRAILNSQTYQRRIRPGEFDHLLFAASNPTRLSADALWQMLVDILGPLTPPGAGPPMKKAGPFARLVGPEGVFKQDFSFDPSTKSDEVEGSISQALFMMNNPLLNQKLQARGTNLLAHVLSTYSQDDEALSALYLRTLARRPTDREAARCKNHIRSATSRAEAYEDILWALLNSTEFQSKR